ncbi:putative molybdenum cofactor sulfurase [Phaeomoniella chlamydospora]|uniref:Putative molybdenum cofactor sulfurase n=1 Tax=Phaeomoniella chlamydospora TaxID=158046 RepID=A0A0G2E9R2_PHACM|nr:putative molybdenum cofactor sulfurase [Phaeomoniella chlamydospora]
MPDQCGSSDDRPITETNFYPYLIKQIREREYPCMKEAIYLDHAGATIPAKSTLTRFADDISSSIFANPHSASPSSQRSTERIDAVRKRLLEFFHASPDDYDIVFVANATAAIKLVTEAFSDYGFDCAYHIDSHTSLVATSTKARTARCFYTVEDLDPWLQREEVEPDHPAGNTSNGNITGPTSLVAFPAQSNMTGYRPPYHSWIKHIRTHAHHPTYILLDAAAFTMTGQLELRDPSTSPDLISISLYKIFGFPDIGTLLVRKSSPHLFQIFSSRKYFGGGTVDMVIPHSLPLLPTTLPSPLQSILSSPSPWFRRNTRSYHTMLEDGTLPFHSITAVSHALDLHHELYGSQTQVSLHTSTLLSQLYTSLISLHHPKTNTPICELYLSPAVQSQPRSHSPPSPDSQGPTLSLNILSANSHPLPKTQILTLSSSSSSSPTPIHIRAGGLCNPGGIQTSLSLTPEEMKRNFDLGVRCGNGVDEIHGKPTGVVRISLGAMSTMEEVRGFVDWIEREFGEVEEKREERDREREYNKNGKSN